MLLGGSRLFVWFFSSSPSACFHLFMGLRDMHKNIILFVLFPPYLYRIEEENTVSTLRKRLKNMLESLPRLRTLFTLGSFP